MPAVNTIIILLMALFCLSFAQTIKFAPLPSKPKEELIGEYIPMITYLREKTGLDIKLVYIDSYDKLLQEFKRGSVDITVLGPLPLIKLFQEYKQVEFVVGVKEKDGSSSYRCVLVTTPDGPQSVRELTGPIALPQKISTCGYFAASIILSGYSKDLKSIGYQHFKDHHQAIEAMIRGEFEAAVVREDIFNEYSGYGLKPLAYSPRWPSFVMVANSKTLSKDKIEMIKTALLSASWKDLRNFGYGKYGFSEARRKDYEVLIKYKKFIPE